MNEISFIINEVELYTEKILVEFEIPLLFICKDKSNKRYSVLCVNSDEERYLVVESKVRDIVRMIQNAITMKELFLNAKNGAAWMITAGENFENDKVSIIDINKLAEEDLPADGAFYEVYNADIHDYVDTLLNRVSKENTEYVMIMSANLARGIVEKMDAQKKMFDFAGKEGMANEQSFNKVLYNQQFKL